jgi:hypothetical protein
MLNGGHPIKVIQLLLFLAIFLCYCRKDSSIVVGYLNGVIKHKYTKSPIPGLEIQIEEIRPGIFGSDGTLWDKTTTNSKGEFILKLQKANSNYKYKVQTLLPGTFDTTNITYKFIPDETYLTASQLTNQLNMELEPAGYISTGLWNETWNSVPADSVIITSPFVTGSLIRGNDRIYFYVDPSKLNQFSWYCVKNGINGDTIIKQIYVPNYFKGNGNASVLFYQLTF